MPMQKKKKMRKKEVVVVKRERGRGEYVQPVLV
jgi:hypothetical protein